MDVATIIGIAVAFASLLAMITVEGAHVSSILLPGPIILVFGASIFATIASGTIKDAVYAFKQLPRAFLSKVPKNDEAIAEIVRIAKVARSEGLLALEAESQKTTDPFMRDALQSLADGTDADELRTVLEERIDAKAKQDHVGSNFYNAVGGYAPTIGIVGTVVSLTHVLENLSDPSSLGPMIAAAFIATLWGILSANFIWLPIGAKLQRISDLEVERLTILLEGCMSVQSGSQARVVEDRLRAMLPVRKAASPQAKAA